MVTHVAVDSIWNCTSYRVVYLAAFVSIADMPQQDVTVITARKVTTKIPPRQLVIAKFANVSLASRQLAPHDARHVILHQKRAKIEIDPHFVRLFAVRDGGKSERA